jgi:probable F420-dependent oxidoreductase
MQIGISVGITARHGDIGVIAKKAEDLGFESIWLPEHPIIPINYTSRYGGTADGSVPEGMSHQVNPMIALARASATTTTLKLGTAINLVTEHNPLDLAKQISTLDHFSGGRFLFGIGVGWFREEAEIMGVDFDHRGTQAREHVLAMKELWTKDEAEFHGRYVDFPLVRCYPKPAQKPHPPVLIGGSAENVFRRIVDWGDGWIPVRVTPDMVRAARASLSELAESSGRDPKTISITIHGQPADADMIKRFEEASADRVLVGVSAADHESTLAQLDEIAQKVLA